MPFKLSNILHKADRRGSTSTTSSQSETRALHEEPVTARISKSQSLSGPRLTVTDAADRASPQSLRPSSDGSNGHYDPDYGWQVTPSASVSAPTSPVPPPTPSRTRSKDSVPPLRLQTRSDSGRSFPPGAGARPGAGQPQNLTYTMARRQDFDDLETPTAARPDGEFFAGHAASTTGRPAGIDGLPSRSYTGPSETEVKPLTAENLELAPALSPTISTSAAPPPLPARGVPNRGTASSVSPPDKTIPLHLPVPASSASVVSTPTGNTLAIPAEPTTKRRAGSISSQRSAPVHGIGALIGASSHAANAHGSPATSAASTHSTPGEVLHDLKAKVKDKVRKRRHRKSKDADGMSQRGSMYSVMTNGDDDAVSHDGTAGAGRPRSGTGGSSLRHNGIDRRTRTESNASSHRPQTEDGSFIGSDEEDDDDVSDDEYDDDDARSGSFTSRGSLSLPVTGFAVASNKRNMDFHALFPEVDEDDYLIEGEEGPRVIQRSIRSCCPPHRLRVRTAKGHPRAGPYLRVREPPVLSCQHLWLGYQCEGVEPCQLMELTLLIPQVVIPFSDVVSLEKKMTAFVIPNAICVSTNSTKVRSSCVVLTLKSLTVISHSTPLPPSSRETPPTTSSRTSGGKHGQRTVTRGPAGSSNPRRAALRQAVEPLRSRRLKAAVEQPRRARKSRRRPASVAARASTTASQQ